MAYFKEHFWVAGTVFFSETRKKVLSLCLSVSLWEIHNYYLFLPLNAQVISKLEFRTYLSLVGRIDQTFLVPVMMTLFFILYHVSYTWNFRKNFFSCFSTYKIYFFAGMKPKLSVLWKTYVETFSITCVFFHFHDWPIYLYIYISVSIYLYIPHMYVYIYLFICIYICNIYLHICIYVYMFHTREICSVN